MFGRPAHDGEATGLAVRADACVVRLRTSPVDRLLLVLHTIIGAAFGIAVLWLGAAFLVSPSTAAAVPVQTFVYGAVKGGKDKAAGGRASASPLFLLTASDDDGGESDSGGGDSDGGDSGSDESSDSGSDSDNDDSREESSSESDE